MTPKVSEFFVVRIWILFTQLGTSGIQTSGNSSKKQTSMRGMAQKPQRYFYLPMKKPLSRYFQVRSPYCHITWCKQETATPSQQ